MTRIVIGHDFMETFGGAERVTAEMAHAFPDAPIYSILGRASVAARMGVADRHTSLISPRTKLLKRYRLAAPLFPLIVERARLPESDLLLTSSYAFVHGLRTENDAPQICYCHSPLRFAWSMTDRYRSEFASRLPSTVGFNGFAAMMRRFDRRAASRVSRFLTQSPYVSDQIERFYGRSANVIGAPVDTATFQPPSSGMGHEDYFLFCGRLVEPYKRAGITIEAFNSIPSRLVVAGDGPSLNQLRRLAPRNVEFVGHVGDEELVSLMQRCRALIFPSRDDFGLLPLEAMACGRPVLAFRGGGAIQTVIPGETGELFDQQTTRAITEAVLSFDPDRYDPARIRAHALNWDREKFQVRLVAAVEELLSGQVERHQARSSPQSNPVEGKEAARGVSSR